MKLTIPVDDAVAARARERARAMGRSLRQLVRDYIAELADADQAARDVEDWRRLSREARNRWADDWDRLSHEARGDSHGWTLNRGRSTLRYERAQADAG